MSTTGVHFVELATTVQFVEQPTTLHTVERATTVTFPEASTTAHFVERSTTVAFPQCSISQEEFDTLLTNFLASRQSFASNEAAAAVLDVGEVFKFSAGSDVAPRGVLQIVY